MSSKVVIPSLSEDHWASGSIKVADILLSHFFLSDYSQTYLYPGMVSSLPWILQETQNDMARTLTLAQSTLSNYFNKHFNNVVVEVSEVENKTNPSKAQISLYIQFTDNDKKEYVIGKLLEIADTKITKIINQNNYG